MPKRRNVALRVEARRARVIGRRTGLLQGAKDELELGRFLDAQSRAEFAAELQKRLRI